MRQNRLIYLSKKIDSTFLYILCPGGLSNAKLYKVGHRTPSKNEPSTQSASKRSLSISVILFGFPLLYVLGIF